MSTSTLLLVVVAVVALWASVFFALPAIARAKFTSRLAELRDEADDAVIEGRLPDSEPVQRYLAKVDGFIAEPQLVSLSFMLAVHSAHYKQRGRLALKPITYAGLTASQRKLMHKLDDKLVAAMAEHIKFGSRFVLPFWCMGQVYGRSRRLKVSGAKVLRAPRSRKQLAREFNRFTTPGTGSRDLVGHS